MERALFLIEATGERISALLNPEQLTLTRASGLRPLTAGAGAVTGPGLSDTPLIATGGGVTELTLDLLFDIDLIDAQALRQPGGDIARAETEPAAAEPPLSGAALAGLDAPRPADVRHLTRPFWNLAENAAAEHRAGVVPQVRFIWGRSWNILGVVTDVAERFERFDGEGRPRRSFLRMRLRRLPETLTPPRAVAGPQLETASFFEPPPAALSPGEAFARHITVEVDENGIPNPRFDRIGTEYSGNPADWRIVADHNDIADPLHLEPGQVIALPPASGNSAVGGTER